MKRDLGSPLAPTFGGGDLKKGDYSAGPFKRL